METHVLAMADRIAFETVVPNPQGDEALNLYQVRAVLDALAEDDLLVLLGRAGEGKLHYSERELRAEYEQKDERVVAVLDRLARFRSSGGPA